MRIGKIARLPDAIREQINCRLQDGENGQSILDWLNALPEAKAVLAQEFDGREINEVNLSAWRTGGFRDWEAQQVALAEARRVVSEGKEMGEGLVDGLAAWVVGRYVVATRQLLAKDDAKGWKLLRELTHDLGVLRRGEQGAEGMRLARERLEYQRERDEVKREQMLDDRAYEKFNGGKLF